MADQYITRQRYQDAVIARSYDGNRFGRWRHRLKNKNTELVIARAMRRLPVGAEVLDLPCGTGRLVQLMQRRLLHWLGGDVSMEMMRVAKEKSSDLELGRGFVRLDAVNLPFSHERFDAVLSIRFIQHIPDALRHQVLSEFFRVSRRWLIIEYKIYNPLLAATKKVRGKSLSYNRRPEDVVAELSQAGFRVVEILPVSRLASTAKIYVCEKLNIEGSRVNHGDQRP